MTHPQIKELAKSKGCVECHGLSGNTDYESDDNKPVMKIAGHHRHWNFEI